jgi:2-polyprenyl-3-methyl-5-hydroxy-6-metoxy-1,4-benzoquinol methylase
MALELGPSRYHHRLDAFMEREGYVSRKRLYHRVVRCWCGSASLSSAGESFEEIAHYQYCEDCGCLILKDVLAKEDIGELYGPRYYREHQIAIGLPDFAKRYETDADDRIPVWIEILKRFCKKGRVLEIGSSHGRFLKELSALGYDVVGLDLDPGICNWAREKTNCNIRCTTVDKIKDEEFDVVFAGDVLEHLYDPKEFVQQVMEVLRPGGMALFQTIIFDHWRQCPIEALRPLFHTILYTRRSLRLLEGAHSSFIDVIPSVFGCTVAVFVKKDS